MLVCLVIIVISRARPTLNLPCISPQNSVMCNGEYRRPVIKAQPSSRWRNRWQIRRILLTNGLIFSTLRHTDPNTFAVEPLEKMAWVMSIYFETCLFCELKIAKESNDLADLAKVLPESYQKSNEFSVNRKCRQNVATDDRRTFTDKDKVHRIQTLGNDNKDAMFACESGSHQSEDKPQLNCHKLKVLANEDTLLRTQCCS